MLSHPLAFGVQVGLYRCDSIGSRVGCDVGESFVFGLRFGPASALVTRKQIQNPKPRPYEP